jgi:hypothetical protein
MTQEAKYTPGPYEAWPVKDDRLKRWMVVCVNPGHCPGTGKQVLAERIRTEADARLFAAAPKMLAALQTVANWCSDSRDDRTTSEIEDIVFAAIAEAIEASIGRAA